MAIGWALVITLGLPLLAGSPAAKRELALKYYEQAVAQRQQIESLPQDQRTPVVYEKAAGAFRRVYLTSPQSSKAGDSLLAVGEIYAEMEKRFGPGPYRSKAIEAYQFLLREYPLNPLRLQARRKLEELGSQPGSGTTENPRPPAATEPSAPAPSATPLPSSSTKLPQVTDVRHWSSPGLTRVVVSLEAEAKVKGDRLTNPDRVYFDLPGIRLSPALKGKTVAVDDELVKQIRMAHTQVGVTRVVVDLKTDAAHTVSMLTNPPRVVVEIRQRGLSARAATATAITTPPAAIAGIKPSAPSPAAPKASPPKSVLDTTAGAKSPAPVAPPPAALKASPPKSAPDTMAGAKSPEPVAPSPAPPKASPPKSAPDTTATARSPEPVAPSPAAPKASPPKSVLDTTTTAKSPEPVAPSPAAPKASPPKSVPDTTAAATSLEPVVPSPAVPNAAPPKSAPDATTTARSPEPVVPSPAVPKVSSPRSAPDTTATAKSIELVAPSPAVPKAAPPKSTVVVATARRPEPAATSPAPPKIAPPKAAQPTSRGERNLVRALGLKIGRVVIDAGHGGHDTGTIGPTGLMEKDLTLDVARRLGDLIAERTGSEVVFTRTDDTFVGLEERSALANEKQADLFISIHANSSRLPAVRGIETYYLNLTADREALEVAARENAASQKSIHELQDLVSRITLTEKISESREFAAQVQRALHTTVARDNATLRNRGVRKAPFLVLIGARMPSVLAEISFLSNPRDERLLKTSAYRQKMAEALYRGVAGYTSTLSRVEVAVK